MLTWLAFLTLIVLLASALMYAAKLDREKLDLQRENNKLKQQLAVATRNDHRSGNAAVCEGLNVTELAYSATKILADRGMTGTLTELTGNLWLLTGHIGTDGAVAQIAGKPDEELLGQAADQLHAAISADTFGR